MSYTDDLQDTVDEMYSATVIPRRSVDRIRRAIAEGRDPEPYLQDIEDGLQHVAQIMNDQSARRPCQACSGSGVVAASTREDRS